MEKRTFRRMSIGVLALMVTALFMLASCATTGTGQKGGALESSIMNSYAYKTYLQGDNIVISSTDGRVALEGTVPDASHKFLAEKVARSVVGVKDVDNRLQAEGGTPAKGSDAWVASQVKAELMMHPDVMASQTDVFSQDGVVTLRGRADSGAQRSLAAEYARNVEGVKNVVNAITVAGLTGAQPQASAMSRDDAAITARVETALDTNTSTSDLDVAVESYGGVVTVIGTAESQAQKDLVTRIVTDISGVRAVNNEMTVQAPAALLDF